MASVPPLAARAGSTAPGGSNRLVLASAGGKDSTLALSRARAAGLQVEAGLVVADAGGRAGFHGVPARVVARQMELLGLEPRIRQHRGHDFEEVFRAALAELVADGFGGIVFGNLHLSDVRAWYEERTREAGLAHVEPLWGSEPRDVVRAVVEEGWAATVVAVMTTPPDPGAHGTADGGSGSDQEKPASTASETDGGSEVVLENGGKKGVEIEPGSGAGFGTGPAVGDPAWLGRTLDRDLLDEMEARGIDLAGERGEYHTLVMDGPGFRAPLEGRSGPVEHRSGHALLRWE